jgi:hypothetical protein
MTERGHWLLFLLNGQAFVPTMARTEAGFYMGIDPVEVVDARDQIGLEQAVMRVVNRGNPSVPTPARSNFPKNPMLKYAKVKQSSFNKFAQYWQLSKRDGAYFIVPYRPRNDGVGKEEDVERGEAIPAEVPLETVVRRLVRRVLESDRQEAKN